ncbi:MAG: hypothetical protein AVDCRST_MAG66-2837, partial [uncultured Pseudonocardia sp.]
WTARGSPPARPASPWSSPWPGAPVRCPRPAP